MLNNTEEINSVHEKAQQLILSPNKENAIKFVENDLGKLLSEYKSLQKKNKELQEKLESSEISIGRAVMLEWSGYIVTDASGVINCSKHWQSNQSPDWLIGKSIIDFFEILIFHNPNNYHWDNLRTNLNTFYISGEAPFLKHKFIIKVNNNESHEVVFKQSRIAYGYALIASIRKIKISNKETDNLLLSSENTILIPNLGINTDLKDLVNQANLIIITFNTDGFVTYAPTSWTDLHGINISDTLNTHFSHLMHPTDKALFELFLRRVISKKAKYEGLEYRVKNNKSDWNWHRTCLTPKLDESGNVVSVIAIATDITSRKKTEIAWAQSEKKFRTLFNNMDSGFILIQMAYNNSGEVIDGTVIDVNPTTEKIINMNKRKIIGKFMSELLPENNSIFKKKYHQILTSKESVHFEYYSRKLDKQFEIVLYAASDNEIAAIVTDVTEQQKYERELLRSKNELSIIFEHAPSTLLLIDSNRNVININKTNVEYTPASENELMSADLLDCFYAWENNDCGIHNNCTSCGLRLLLEKTLTTKTDLSKHEIIFSIIRNKKRLPLTIVASTVYIRDDDNPKVLISINDVSKERRIEEALLENEERYRLLSDLTIEGILIQQDNKILDYNPAFSKLTGWKKEDIYNKNFLLILFKYNELNLILNKKTLTETVSLECEINTSTQQQIPVELSSQSFNFKGKTAQVIRFHDIQEQRNLQTKITQAIISTEEKDRSYFARELHDGLGPLLSTAKIYIKAANSTPEINRRMLALQKLEEAINESILSVREISNRLSPHVLENFGITAALQAFFTRLDTMVNVQIKSNLEKRLEKNTEIMLYRVMVELLNNTIKHSKAKNVLITILESTKKTTITYTDDGVGFDVEDTLSKHQGMGLFNILNRIKTLNGKVIINSKPTQGISVHINVPTQKENL